MSTASKNIIEYKKKFGLQLKKLRIRKGMSQLDLASYCNLEKTSISRIENGRTNTTLKTMVILSESLEVELKDFFNFK